MIMREGGAVGPEGVLAVDPADQITPVRRRNIPMRHRLEVENIQRIAGTSDRTIDRLRLRGLPETAREIRRARVERTGCQKFDERTPGIHGFIDSRWVA